MDINTSIIIAFIVRLSFSLLFVIFLALVAKFVASRVRRNIYNSSIESNAYNDRFADLMSEVSYRGMLTFIVMIFFEMMGINIGFLITGLTFGIGFAIKDVLGNMFAGLMILTNKKFTIGDIVQFQGGLDYFGKIIEINVRQTIIQTFDHRRVIVPNIILVSNFVKTYSTEEIIKTSIEIDLGFQDDPALVCKGIKEYLDTKDFIVNPEVTKVMVKSVFHSGYNIQMFFYLKPKGKTGLLVAKSLIQKELLQLFEKNGRTYPRDHFTITTDKNDAALQRMTEQITNEGTDVKLTT